MLIFIHPVAGVYTRQMLGILCMHQSLILQIHEYNLQGRHVLFTVYMRPPTVQFMRFWLYLCTCSYALLWLCYNYITVKTKLLF